MSPADFEIMFIQARHSETKGGLKVEATGERKSKREWWRQVQWASLG